MKPASFEYKRVRTIEEAFKALAVEDAKIIAGGQSLVPMMNFRLVQPELLVDINDIAELSQTHESEREVRIGALTRHVQARSCGILHKHFPIIADAMHHVAHQAIRNRGTIGGSLAHADPSAEWPLLVTLLDGQIELQSTEAKRTLAPSDFFLAPLVTAIEENEILTAIRFAKPDAATGMGFEEHALRAGDFAIVAAGAVLTVENGVISKAHIALGGVADVPTRALAGENFLLSKPLTEDNLRQAAALSGEGLSPNSDLHVSAEYRLHLVPVLALRALMKAAQKIWKETPGSSHNE